MRHFKSFAYLSFAVALAGCASEVTTEGDESVASQSQEIINGQTLYSNTFGDVAIFHREPDSSTCDSGELFTPLTQIKGTNKWWPRPCSGKIIRKTGSTYYVLTARHCVTTNGEIDGTLTSVTSDFRLTTGLDPGTLQTDEGTDANGPWMQVNQTPNTNYSTASVLVAGSPKASNTVQNQAKYDHGEDLAILKVTGGSYFSATTGRVALSTDALAGVTQVYSQGYGRFVAGHCQGHDGSGAGHLRQGAANVAAGVQAGFPVTNVTSKTFDIGVITKGTATTSDDVQLVGGDSGSPIFTEVLSTGYKTLVGVASNSVTMGGGPNLIKWLMQNLGGLFLIDPADYHNSNRLIGAGTATDGSNVLFNLSGDSALTRIKYDWTTQNLKFGTLCAADEGGYVRMRNCTTSTSQKWSFSGIQIKNVGTARCLMRGPSEVVASTCSTASNLQKWMFVTDDDL